jgi:hypothetical protein
MPHLSAHSQQEGRDGPSCNIESGQQLSKRLRQRRVWCQSFTFILLRAISTSPAALTLTSATPPGASEQCAAAALTGQGHAGLEVTWIRPPLATGSTLGPSPSPSPRYASGQCRRYATTPRVCTMHLHGHVRRPAEAGCVTVRHRAPSHATIEYLSIKWDVPCFRDVPALVVPPTAARRGSSSSVRNRPLIWGNARPPGGGFARMRSPQR